VPTGYTAAIAEDITFKQFAMNCARAFGACIELRDESGGGEVIPEKFESSSYHLDAKAKDEAALAALRAMTVEEQVAAAQKAYTDAEASRLKYLAEKAALKAKYLKMLDAVVAWCPPTPEHQGLKGFMIKQIQDSVQFDCGGGFYETPTVRVSPAEWIDEQGHLLTRSIARHEFDHQKEVARTNERNAWVAALRKSLK
jgi:hypothetical protein